MLLVVGLQLGSIAITALLALVLAGPLFAWSAVLGGLIVIIPNALFAWQLARVTRAEVFPAVFVAGEAVKVFLTIAMLLALSRSNIEFHWVMLVAAMAIAVKAPMLRWFIERRSVRNVSASAPEALDGCK
ncbi:MAG: ATP synthase subunit I [Burkholderiaceae bacterium]